MKTEKIDSNIEKITFKWNEILQTKPTYLNQGDYHLVKEYYDKINSILIKNITDSHFTYNQIDLMHERIDTYQTLIRRDIGDKIFISIWADNLSTIEEMIEDCAYIELYEGAYNLKRLLDKINV